jgi:hypothetical protein
MCARSWRHSLALAGLILLLGAPGRGIAEEATDAALENKLAKLEARIEALERENAALRRKPVPKAEPSAALGIKSTRPEVLAYAKASAPRRAAPAVLSGVPVPVQVWSGIYAGASFGAAALKASESIVSGIPQESDFAFGTFSTISTSSSIHSSFPILEHHCDHFKRYQQLLGPDYQSVDDRTQHTTVETPTIKQLFPKLLLWSHAEPASAEKA